MKVYYINYERWVMLLLLDKPCTTIVPRPHQDYLPAKAYLVRVHFRCPCHFRAVVSSGERHTKKWCMTQCYLVCRFSHRMSWHSPVCGCPILYILISKITSTFTFTFGHFHFHNAFTSTLRPLCNSFLAFSSFYIFRNLDCGEQHECIH